MKKGGFTIITKNELETLIRKGKDVKEIQEEIIGFPSNPTTEYLERLGYEHIQAIKLKWRLRQNNKERQKEEARRQLLTKKNLKNSFYFSPNADPNDILLDTSSFGYQKGIELIEESAKVTILKSVLDEMDEVKTKLEKQGIDKKKFLLDNIIFYEKQIIKKSKYHLIFDKNKSKNDYEDNNILLFIDKIPEERRPTLLTADRNLALRAKSCGIEYIFIANHSIKKPEPKKKQETKKENIKGGLVKNKINLFGIEFQLQETKIAIKKYNPKPQVYFVKGETIKLSERYEEKSITSFDYIVILVKRERYRNVKISKVKVVNEKIQEEEIECVTINEIYKQQMPETLLDTAKKILIS